MPDPLHPCLAEIPAKAHQTRRAFESGCFDVSVARRAYTDYAPDIDVDLFLSHSRRLFPALNCGLCSTYLRAVLHCGTVRRGRYNADLHTVLIVGSTVIDVTADQFGGPPVYIGPLRQPWTLP